MLSGLANLGFGAFSSLIPPFSPLTPVQTKNNKNTKLTMHALIQNSKTPIIHPSIPMKLSSLTYLAFELNALLDICPNHDLPFTAIHDAADLGLLVEHLDKWFPGQIDLSLLLSNADELTQVEIALRDSAEGMYGRDVSSRGRDASGLCLVMAIVLNAIQHQFIPLQGNSSQFKGIQSNSN